MKAKTYTGADAMVLRYKRNLNQSQFWSKLGVTQSAGSRYESGRNIPKPLQQLLVVAYGTESQSQRAVESLRA